MKVQMIRCVCRACGHQWRSKVWPAQCPSCGSSEMNYTGYDEVEEGKDATGPAA